VGFRKDSLDTKANVLGSISLNVVRIRLGSILITAEHDILICL
jgi:hypothetical protein